MGRNVATEVTKLIYERGGYMKKMTFGEFCNEKADRRRFSHAHFGKRYFKRDLVLLNIGRYEYAASVNLDSVLSVWEPAKAAIDNNMDAVVWFGNDAHGKQLSWPKEWRLQDRFWELLVLA